MLRALIFTLCVLPFLFVPQPLQAKIEITFSDPPAQIHMDQTLSLDVTLSGANASTSYYFRGVFYKQNTTSYFGYTLNNAQVWHSSSVEHKKFFQITGNQTTTIEFKPDLNSTFYQGSGNYLFKIGRYTEGGSVTWSEQIMPIFIIDTTPSPSPTPSPTPTAVPTPTPVPTTTPTNLPSPPPDFPTQITLSEIMPCPEEGNEWVEIKNNHPHPVTLVSWLIRDETVNNKYLFSVSIPAHGLAVVEVTPPILNNTNDSVKLLNPVGNLVAEMSYSNCTKGQSFIWHENTWKKTSTPTKGGNNQYTSVTSPSPNNSLTLVPKASSVLIPTAEDIPKPTSSEISISSSYSTHSSTPLLFNSDFDQYQIGSTSGRILGSITVLSPSLGPASDQSSPEPATAPEEISPSLTSAWLTLFGGSSTYLSVGGYWLWKWYNQNQSMELQL